LRGKNFDQSAEGPLKGKYRIGGGGGQSFEVAKLHLVLKKELKVEKGKRVKSAELV